LEHYYCGLREVVAQAQLQAKINADSWIDASCEQIVGKSRSRSGLNRMGPFRHRRCLCQRTRDRKYSSLWGWTPLRTFWRTSKIF